MFVQQITALQKECIINWKQEGIHFTQTGFLKLVEQNHAFNYQLWHAEDRARREDLGYEFVYKAKRDIDNYNQKRNNYMEAMDEWLFKALNPSKNPICPMHSETPGMMIDRISILALKIYHMQLQVERKEVDATHRKNCQTKYQILVEQHEQLQNCLQQLLEEIKAQKRTFKIYQQFKMYNDPNLNPEIYEN